MSEFWVFNMTTYEVVGKETKLLHAMELRMIWAALQPETEFRIKEVEIKGDPPHEYLD